MKLADKGVKVITSGCCKRLGSYAQGAEVDGDVQRTVSGSFQLQQCCLVLDIG